MPIVLVVDDSPVDRRLIGGLLDNDLNWVIEYAENGAAALREMQELLPDVIVTDLQMPEMDGLSLVSAVREQCPQVPVVLVTAHGSEELAIEALDRGAASYVPKSQLAEKLLQTVEQVLGLSQVDRSYERLVQCLECSEFSFVLENDTSLIAPLVDFFQQIVVGAGICNETGRVHLSVALEEALINGLYHGNLELPVESLQTARADLHKNQVSPLIEKRRSEAPYADRRLHVQARISREEASFTIRDDGKGFDISRVPKPGDPTTLEYEGGRGLVLIGNFMSQVSFNEAGNEITIVMRSE